MQSKIYHSCAANRSWVLDEVHRYALWRGVAGREQAKDHLGTDWQGLSSRTWKPVANHSCGKFRLDLGPRTQKWLTMNVGLVGLKP